MCCRRQQRWQSVVLPGAHLPQVVVTNYSELLQPASSGTTAEITGHPRVRRSHPKRYQQLPRPTGGLGDDGLERTTSGGKGPVYELLFVHEGDYLESIF